MKFSVKSTASHKEVILEYNDEGLLKQITFDDDLTSTAISWLLNTLPAEVGGLSRLPSKTLSITQIDEAYTFEDFWEAYFVKVGKLNAQKEWSKLSSAEQAKAVRKANQYHAWRNRQTPVPAPLHPERYLKHRRFDDALNT